MNVVGVRTHGGRPYRQAIGRGGHKIGLPTAAANASALDITPPDLHTGGAAAAAVHTPPPRCITTGSGAHADHITAAVAATEG